MGFWWSPGEDNASQDNIWDGNLVGFVKPDLSTGKFTVAGLVLGRGEGSVAVGNVAVGIVGFKNCSGFHWPSQGSDLWVFDENVAHNNKCQGIFVWQNSSANHLITDFVGYRNGGFGVNHGAYSNNYVNENLYLVENGTGGVLDHASANAKIRSEIEPQRWSW